MQVQFYSSFFIPMNKMFYMNRVEADETQKNSINKKLQTKNLTWHLI